MIVVVDWAKKSTGACSRNEERCTLKKAGSRKEKQVSGKEYLSFKNIILSTFKVKVHMDLSFKISYS